VRTALGDDRAEVVEQRGRGLHRALGFEAGADHLDGLTMERG
jgi:hypothetical protein